MFSLFLYEVPRTEGNTGEIPDLWSLEYSVAEMNSKTQNKYLLTS